MSQNNLLIKKLSYSMHKLFFLIMILLSPTATAENNDDALFELFTQENQIIDSSGHKFKLKSVNWFGAHESSEVTGGLDKQPLAHIVDLIKTAGFNSVRLTYSNQMLHNTHLVDPKRVAANPLLATKTPLEVFDSVINALTDAGIVVILNNHTTISNWCCSFGFDGLWHHPSYQSTEQWINDWIMLASRYRENSYVAAFDLRNEVRTGRFRETVFPEDPNWGLGDKNDWKLAATLAANSIHAVNPKLLIVVEGINWAGVPMLTGHRPMLTPVKNDPIFLTIPNKLIYEEHIYAFTGPTHTGDSKSSIGQLRYSDMDEPTLRATIEAEFGYVLEPGHPYTAPVWLGEFGVGYDNPSESDKIWFQRIIDYLLEKDMGWALWALNPEREDGMDDSFGLLNKDWSDYRQDWRQEFIQKLLQG